MGSSARRRGTGRALLAVLALTAVVALAQAAPALAALDPFNGGPIAVDCPTTIANDHSVYALRFSVDSTNAGEGQVKLKPDTSYHLKVRFSPEASPAGSDNRGFTWNGETRRWVQEREDWGLFPAITTDASGNWAGTGNSDWLYAKFGDTTRTGQYYVLISLSTGVKGETTNCAMPIQVSVIDAATAVYWVHAGEPQASAAGKRADVVVETDAGNGNAAPLSLVRAEPNGCDDDSNGTVDDEQPGLSVDGGFRLVAPVSEAVNVRVQKAVWPPESAALTNATPDVDVALGGDDSEPPAAPAALTATGALDGVHLSWAASASGDVDAYHVYRWTDAPAGAGYTMPLQRIVQTGVDTTAYVDEAVVPGAIYHYVVRAVDATTNVSARSPQADAGALVLLPTALSLTASKSIVNWNASVTLTGDLAVTDDGALVAGQQVQLEQSFTKTDPWTVVRSLDPTAASPLYEAKVVPKRATYFRLVFDGTEGYTASMSEPVKVTPKAKVGKPVAPPVVRRGVKFTVYGSLVPKHAARAKNVTVKCYRKTAGGKWVLKKKVKAANVTVSGKTRYKVRISLGPAGNWMLIAAYGKTAKHAASVSSARQVKVR